MTQLAAPVTLGAISQANGSTSAVGNVNAVPFQTGWLVVFANSIVSFAGAEVIVNDIYSGVVYQNTQSAPTNVPPLSMPVTGLNAAGLTVELINLPVNSSGFARNVAYVLGLFGVGVEAVVNSPSQPLYVHQVPDPLSGYTGGKILSVHVAQAPAVGASTTIINGVAGEYITVFGWDLWVGQQAGAVGLCQCTLEDTTAAVVLTDMLERVTTAVGALTMHSAIDIPTGIQLPVGAGLKSVAAAGNTGVIDVRGAIYYTQQ